MPATTSAQVVQRRCGRWHLADPRPTCLPEAIQEAAAALRAARRLATRLLQLSQALLKVAVCTVVATVGRHITSFAERAE